MHQNCQSVIVQQLARLLKMYHLVVQWYVEMPALGTLQGFEPWSSHICQAQSFVPLLNRFLVPHFSDAGLLNFVNPSFDSFESNHCKCFVSVT